MPYRYWIWNENFPTCLSYSCGAGLFPPKNPDPLVIFLRFLYRCERQGNVNFYGNALPEFATNRNPSNVSRPGFTTVCNMRGLGRGYCCYIILQPYITKGIKILRRTPQRCKNLIKYCFLTLNSVRPSYEDRCICYKSFYFCILDPRICLIFFLLLVSDIHNSNLKTFHWLLEKKGILCFYRLVVLPLLRRVLDPRASTLLYLQPGDRVCFVSTIFIDF